MKKIIILAALSLAACHSSPQDRQNRVDDMSSRVCIDGVSYIYMPNSYGGSIAPHLKVDGRPHTC